jgi:hypothetical protein
MAKTKETTALVSAELQRSLDIILSSKQEIDKIGENCLQIKVVDESTLSIAQQNLSKANDMAKFIEAKRVEVKQPHLDNCKTIDATCKELSEAVLKGVAHLKEEIKAWELKRIEQARLEQEALEKRQREEAEVIEAENKRKELIQAHITKLTEYCKKVYPTIASVEDCDKFEETLNTKWPTPEKMQEFYDQAIELRNNYLDLTNVKRQQLTDAGNMSEEQKQLIIERQDILAEKEKLAEKERLLNEKEAGIAAEKAKKEAEEKAKKEAEELAAKQAMTKTSGVRKTWKFELIDKTKLPADWIILDDAKAKEYLTENKDKLKHNDVVNGVKFYQEVNISA